MREFARNQLTVCEIETDNSLQNGLCGEDGTCTCNSNYYGPDCSTFCTVSTCNYHGQCDQNGLCDCSDGWEGPTCNTGEYTFLKLKIKIHRNDSWRNDTSLYSNNFSREKFLISWTFWPILQPYALLPAIFTEFVCLLRCVSVTYITMETHATRIASLHLLAVGMDSASKYENLKTLKSFSPETGACECFEGYNGTSCSGKFFFTSWEYSTLHTGAICTQGCFNGVCTDSDVCTCNPDFYGSTCSVYCHPNITCNSHGQCSTVRNWN